MTLALRSKGARHPGESRDRDDAYLPSPSYRPRKESCHARA